MSIVSLSPLEQFLIYPSSGGYFLLGATQLPFFVLSNFTFFFLLVSCLFFSSLRTFVSIFSKPLLLNLHFIIFRCVRGLMQLIRENFSAYGFLFCVYLFILFFLIILTNCVGMIPYSFAITSHLIVTLFLSFLSFIIAVFVGVKIHGVRFFGLFLPSGAPLFLAPFLVGIEFVSYCARLFSLAIRLFANIMAGHTLLKILANFSWLLFIQSAILASFVPFIIIVLVTGLEFMIAILQAYVFTVLTMIYFNESIVLH